MVKTTKEQRKAILRKWQISDQGLTYRQIRKTIQGTICCDGAVALPWCKMWLCIERDGYTHS